VLEALGFVGDRLGERSEILAAVEQDREDERGSLAG
jgi:hypothetical protein